MSDDITKRFTYQVPKEEQASRIQALRKKTQELGLLINELCPKSRQQSLALTKLEETLMWANKSIVSD